ncbi:MAG: tRNA (guanosine(37)-N1)-methyltransferase TrmD [Candidatus Pacebacteria bacterium]|nr:tRNA (guanosine(37)-N1)-methyltransferase TrmD [Candidatus Paceibacterota bacterium]
MHFHIITIFPEMFDSYIHESIIARAIKNKKISVSIYNPRDLSKDKHKKVDDTPYGGGPGMVMSVDPIVCAIKKAQQKIARRKKSKIKIIMTSPSGKELTNEYSEKLLKNKYTDVVIICGRYEGIDARVKKIFRAEDVSIGNYVLTGGELPAMIMVDVISRRIPGVLGNIESLEENRVSSSETYTRPEIYKYDGKEYKVPKVLLSGHHKKIEEWKKSK